MAAPSIGWSDFARKRYVAGRGHSYFLGGEEELVALVAAHWEKRRPGQGCEDLAQVVLVPLPPERFVSGTVQPAAGTRLHARLERRQPEEAAFIEVRAEGPREAVRFVDVVLYSAATLLENGGRRSGDRDWEIVSIQARGEREEPMRPLTMARNMLGKPGGTPCDYSARQFAEAVWYWAARCGPLPGPELETGAEGASEERGDS